MNFKTKTFSYSFSSFTTNMSMLFQTMSNATRLAIYLLPVTIISFALNIPKFLEVKVTEDNTTDPTDKFEPTDLRTDPSYIFWYLIDSNVFSEESSGI